MTNIIKTKQKPTSSCCNLIFQLNQPTQYPTKLMKESSTKMFRHVIPKYDVFYVLRRAVIAEEYNYLIKTFMQSW